VAALVVGARVACAQARAGYPAVFGGSDTNQSVVTLSMTFAEAYDQDLLTEAGATPQPTLQAGGSYTWLAPQMTVATHGRRLQFNAFSLSSVRYYPTFSQPLATNYNIGGGLMAKPGPHTTISANGGLTYAPTPLYALFAGSEAATKPDAPATAAADLQAGSLRSYTNNMSVTLEQAVTPRVTLTVLGDLQRTNYLKQVAGFPDMQSTDVGGRLTLAATRHVNLRFGFVQRQASYSQSLRTSEQDVELGIAVTRDLSATRRVTFGLNLGPTASDTGLSPTARPHLGLTGDAYVERQIGRSWTARSTFRRGLSYVGGLAGPAYTNGATVEASGFVNRHIDVLASGGFSSGQMAAQLTTAANFTNFMAFTRVRYGLSHAWAVHLEGLFYDYRFDRTVITVPGVPDRMTRVGLRAGLTMFVPVRSGHRVAG
jgi:hypothetical protein